MTQKRTDRLAPSKGTGPLQTADLRLFATAIVLRGRRVLGKRAPKALQKADRALAMPVVRKALATLSMIAERWTALNDVVRSKVADLSSAVARNTVGRVQGLIGTVAAVIRSKLPGGR